VSKMAAHCHVRGTRLKNPLRWLSLACVGMLPFSGRPRLTVLVVCSATHKPPVSFLKRASLLAQSGESLTNVNSAPDQSGSDKKDVIGEGQRQGLGI